MADEADIAAEYSDRELAAALASRPLPPREPGPIRCEECYGEIPQKRREGGYRLCVECARVREARG